MASVTYDSYPNTLLSTVKLYCLIAVYNAKWISQLYIDMRWVSDRSYKIIGETVQIDVQILYRSPKCILLKRDTRNNGIGNLFDIFTCVMQLPIFSIPSTIV